MPRKQASNTILEWGKGRIIPSKGRRQKVGTRDKGEDHQYEG